MARAGQGIDQGSDATVDPQRMLHRFEHGIAMDGAISELMQQVAFAQLFVRRDAEVTQQASDAWLTRPHPRRAKIEESAAGRQRQNTTAQTSSRFEQQSTSTPCRCSCQAAARPLKPPPTIATSVVRALGFTSDGTRQVHVEHRPTLSAARQIDNAPTPLRRSPRDLLGKVPLAGNASCSVGGTGLY